MAKFLSLKITQFTTSSHCAQDDSIFIPVDVQAITESTQRTGSIPENTQTLEIDMGNIYE